MLTTTEAPIAYDYPEGRTDGPYIRRIPVGSRFVQEVTFDHFEPSMSTFVEVRVHWTLAFEYLRATGERVTGVTWASEFGGHSEGWSFAQWVRYAGSECHTIIVGTSHAPALQELRRYTPALDRYTAKGGN